MKRYFVTYRINNRIYHESVLASTIIEAVKKVRTQLNITWQFSIYGLEGKYILEDAGL